MSSVEVAFIVCGTVVSSERQWFGEVGVFVSEADRLCACVACPIPNQRNRKKGTPALSTAEMHTFISLKQVWTKKKERKLHYFSTWVSFCRLTSAYPCSRPALVVVYKTQMWTFFVYALLLRVSAPSALLCACFICMCVVGFLQAEKRKLGSDPTIYWDDRSLRHRGTAAIDSCRHARAERFWISRPSLLILWKLQTWITV